MNIESLDQEIEVSFKLNQAYSVSKLKSALLSMGFVIDTEQEVIFLPRSDIVGPWQTEECVSVTLRDDLGETYFNRSTCNEIILSNLLSWQPIFNADRYIIAVYKLAELIGVDPTMNGQKVSKAQLVDLIQSIAKALEHRVEPPGGENLAIAIEEKLPL